MAFQEIYIDQNGFYFFHMRITVCFCSMMNVGVQCCKRSGVPAAVKSREKIRVDPFGSKIFFYMTMNFILSEGKTVQQQIDT